MLGFSTEQHWPFPRKYLKNHLVWYSGFSKWTSVLLQVAGVYSEVCFVAQTLNITNKAVWNKYGVVALLYLNTHFPVFTFDNYSIPSHFTNIFVFFQRYSKGKVLFEWASRHWLFSFFLENIMWLGLFVCSRKVCSIEINTMHLLLVEDKYHFRETGLCAPPVFAACTSSDEPFSTLKRPALWMAPSASLDISWEETKRETWFESLTPDRAWLVAASHL